ncbi:unnamed protein product, partial [Polarella glacialis]
VFWWESVMDSRPLLVVALWFALLWQPSASGTSGDSRPHRHLARISLAELRGLDPAARLSLRRALQKDGAVLLTEVPGFDALATQALTSL